MRKFVVTLMASLLTCAAASAFFPEASDSSLEIGVGYRNDNLKWTTSTRCNDSCYSSEFGDFTESKTTAKWENLKIWQIEAKGKYVTCDDIYLRGYADYGWITSGKAKFNRSFGDDSYCSDDGLDFHSNSKKGNVYDASIGIGYQFRMCEDSFLISPVFGYSWHGQDVRHNHRGCSGDSYYSYYDYYSDYSDYSYDYSSSEFFSSSCSSSSSDSDRGGYKTHWRGPWLGVDFEYRLACEWTLFANYEYHWAKYEAHGNVFGFDYDTSLNFGKFRHHAKNAHGQIGGIGVKWDVCDCWTVALAGEFQFFKTTRGSQRTTLAEFSGCGETVKVQDYIPLRSVQWNSAAVVLDVGYLF